MPAGMGGAPGDSAMVSEPPPEIDTGEVPERLTVPLIVAPAPPETVNPLARTPPPKLLAPPDISIWKLGTRRVAPFISRSAPKVAGSVSGPKKSAPPVNTILLPADDSSGLSTMMTPRTVEPPVKVTTLGASTRITPSY